MCLVPGALGVRLWTRERGGDVHDKSKTLIALSSLTPLLLKIMYGAQHILLWISYTIPFNNFVFHILEYFIMR